MSNKQRKNFMLREETIEKINKLSVNEAKSKSEIVDLAIHHFYKNKEEEHQFFIKTLSELLDEKMKDVMEVLNKIRVTSNVVDRETKMMLEFWNHYFFIHEFDAIATTDKVKTDALIEAEHVVKKIISERRQRKIDKDVGRKNVASG